MSDTIKLLINLLNGHFENVLSMTEADWQQVIEEAQWHGVAPFLWYTLYPALDCPQLPPGIQETLRTNYHIAAVHFMRREHELKEVLQTLASAGVPVVLLKGTAMAYSVYPNPVLRTMNDVDLWIPHAQLVPAREALHAIGYNTVRSKEDYRPQALKDALNGETPMMRDRPGAGLVELHWNVYPGEWLRHTTCIDEAKIWARSVPIEGRNMRRLAAEDLVLHASMHLAVNHQMNGVMRTMLDIALTRRTWEIDWEALVHRAKEWKIATAVWLVLSLVSEFFGETEARLPLHKLAPSRFRQRALHWFVPGIPLSGSPKLTDGPLRFIYQLCLIDRPADVIRLLWRALFPDRAWLVLRYKLQDAPRWRIWLQWIWHPLRLALRRDF